MTVNAWITALTWLDLSGLAIATGALVSALWLFPPAEESGGRPDQSGSQGPWARRLFGLSLCLLSISSLGILWARTVVMSGMPWHRALSDAPLILQHTHFGSIWLWRLGILALGWITWWRWSYARAGKRGLLPVALLFVAAMAFTRSATGHPADQGDFTLREFSDWLHMMTAAVWIGGVIGSAIVISPWTHGRHSPAGKAGMRSISRLSSLAGFALTLILATGICNAWWALPTVADLWTTDYGRTLLAKLALVAVLIALGALNRYYFIPGLRALESANDHTSPATTMPSLHNRFAVNLIIEALLMILLLAVVAGLTQGIPPQA